uniref:Gustatory receptor n=1 Tax=Tetranychus urticae TaxID=32264 RepID=T1KKB1_TETUR
MRYIKYRMSIFDNQLPDSFAFRWLARRSTVQKSIDLLNYLEHSGYYWLTIIRGYPQEKEIERKYYRIAAFANTVGAILIAKTALTICLKDDYTRLLLGDIFIGSFSHGIQNTVLMMVLTLVIGLRYFGFLTERLKKVVILRKLHQLREKRFDCTTFMLTPRANSYMRLYFYLFGIFYKMTNAFVCTCVSGWLSYNYLSNPINHTSWLTSITTGLWSILTAFVYAAGAFPTIWFYVHNTMIITFAIFSLDSCHNYGQAMANLNCKVTKKAIYKFLTQQNRIYNYIYQHTVDWGKLFFYGILVVSGTGNFILFAATFIGTGSDLLDYALLVLGFVTFNSISIMNVLAAFAANKITLNRLCNYKIARRCKFNLRLSLKLLTTCERLNLNKVGFNLGGICTLDSEHFLLYLMENAGLMLMFITNFNKASSNQQLNVPNQIQRSDLNVTNQDTSISW